MVVDAENDILGEATEAAAQPASTTSDAVASATGCQHQQHFDDRLTGETLLTCIVAWALDLRRLWSRVLLPTVSLSDNDFGQVVHTHVPLDIKQYKSVSLKGR